MNRWIHSASLRRTTKLKHLKWTRLSIGILTLMLCMLAVDAESADARYSMQQPIEKVTQVNNVIPIPQSKQEKSIQQHEQNQIKPVSQSEQKEQSEQTLPKKKVAIVIDDFGNRMGGTEEMMKLPIPITVAVMPFLPTSQQDAELANKLGHEVIVHMPMEPKHGRASWLGPGAILSSQSDAEIEKRVREAIDSIPHAVGMNNHMGSKITGDKHIMRIILRVCKEKGLYYLDSKTNYHSVAGEVAKELQVPIVYNQIFLDDVHTEAHVSRQWGEILKRMSYQSTCVTIGHVGAQGRRTAAVLHRSVPGAMKDFQFVRISDLAHEGRLPLQ